LLDFARADTWTRFWIMAEFGGDDVIGFNNLTDSSKAAATWANSNITAKLNAEDQGAFPYVLLGTEWVAAGDWGWRAVASSDDHRPDNTHAGTSFGIAQLSKINYYQSYHSQTGGKSPTWQTKAWRIGYFRRRWHPLHTPVQITPLTGDDDWHEADISGIVSGAAKIALVRLYYIWGVSGNAMVRSIGSSNPAWHLPSITTRYHLVTLSAAKKFEYNIVDNTVQLWVCGWFEDYGSKVDIDTGEVDIDTGGVNVGG